MTTTEAYDQNLRKCIETLMDGVRDAYDDFCNQLPREDNLSASGPALQIELDKMNKLMETAITMTEMMYAHDQPAPEEDGKQFDDLEGLCCFIMDRKCETRISDQYGHIFNPVRMVPCDDFPGSYEVYYPDNYNDMILQAFAEMEDNS